MSTENFPPQRGSLSLWRYTENERNYPGWHLSVDSAGGTSLLLILLALSDRGGYRTLAVTQPSLDVLRVPNNRGGKASWIAPSRWRISYLSSAEQALDWDFSPQLEPFAELTLGQGCMAELQRGVRGMLEGEGDYSIGHETDSLLRLWFWWRVA